MSVVLLSTSASADNVNTSQQFDVIAYFGNIMMKLLMYVLNLALIA